MMDLFIRNNDPRLSNLARYYDALFAVVEEVMAADTNVRTCESNRVAGGKRPAVLKDQAKWYQREREYEASQHQRLVAVDRLKPLIQPVADECASLRDYKKGDEVRDEGAAWYDNLGKQFVATFLTAKRCTPRRST